MAYSYSTSAGDGVTAVFPFTFVGLNKGYLNKSDVHVEVVDEHGVWTEKGFGTDWVFETTNSIRFLTTPPPVNTVFPHNIRIRRIMDKNSPYADWSIGQNFDEWTLDNSFLKLLYIEHELLDGFGMRDATGNIDMHNYRIINMADAINDKDAVNLGQVKELLETVNAQGIVPIVQPLQVGVSGQSQYNTPATKKAEPASFRVSIDGLLQRPVTDYTTNTVGKIDFVGIVPVGAEIDVVYFEPNNIDLDANNLLVTSTGSTKPRKLEDRFADMLSVKDFGAKGDGFTDDTNAIQAAINSTGYIYFNSGTYLINTDIGLSVPSNTFLIGEPSTTIKGTSSSNTHYELVDFKDVSNSGIYNINIVGERSTHTGTTGEWGMGIQIYDSSDIYIEKVSVSDCWGDGIYLGSTSDASQNKNNYNIHLNSVKLLNNRRQGISVISVDGLWVNESVVQSTNGTAPAAGIDFEPNSTHHTLKNIFVDNLKSWNNASSAILIVTGNLGSQEISITLNNITSHVDNCLLEIHAPSSLLSGFISLSNSTAKNTTNRGGVTITDWDSDCIVTLDNLKFQNLNTVTGQPTNVRCAVNLRVVNSSLSRYRNVHISNIKADNAGSGNSPYDLYLEGASKGLEDCSISNVNWKRTTNIHLVDVNKNLIDIAESSLHLGSPYWAGATGTQNLDVVSHHNYIVGSDGNSKHIELILPDLSAGLVTTARYKLRDLASITGNYDLMLVAPSGQVIHPTNSNKAGIRYTERTHTGNSFDFQCVQGIWTIIGGTADIGTK